MSISSLTDLRKIIDDIDAQIVKLLNERATAALEIGNAKEKLSQNMYDPSREGTVLSHIDKLNKGPLPNGSVEDIYAAIITACREIQIK